MAATQEMKERALECFASIESVQFSASQTSIRAGEEVVLNWAVKPSPGCQFSVAMNQAQVPKTGSRRVRPVGNISYRLAARAAGLSKALGVVNINVNTSGCTESDIPEDLIAPVIQSAVTNSLNEYNADPETENDITERRVTGVEIETQGIVLKLRLKLAINNFFDPDVNIDAVVRIGVSAEGQALVYYKSFSTDVDWPWWVTGITVGITKIIEEFLDGAVEKKIKPRVLADFKARVTSLLASAGTVSRIETAQDRIVVTTCS